MIRRIPHCAHWGAFTALVEDDRIVGIEPFEHDPAPSPIIHAVRDWLDPERRIARPMAREGWLERRERSDRSGRGRERMVELGWDEAITLVADEINRVRDQFGNRSIYAGSYGWTSAGRFHHAQTQIKRLLNQVGGYTGHCDTYSYGAGAVIARHVMGSPADYLGLGATMDVVAEQSDIVLAFGALSPRTAQQEAGGVARHMLETHLRRLVERGTRVVLVSPRRDDVPEWVGADWWPIIPGADAALVLGLAGEVVAAGRQDADFLRRCCSGAEPVLAYLRGESDGIVKDAAWAAGITGLDAGRIHELAKALPGRRSFITMCWALQRAVHGEQPWWAAITLASVLGQIGLPGGGVGFGVSSSAGTGITVSLTRGPSFSQGVRPNDDFIPVARVSDMLLNPGAPFSYEGVVHSYPDVRLVYWAGGNPFHHHQDLNRLARAWQKPETIIVQEPLWTATAQRADIVLPATTSLERNDLAGGTRSDYLLAMQQVVSPRGLARSDYDIMRHIAGELGVEAPFTEGRDEMQWLEHLYTGLANDARERLDVELPSFDAFWSRGYTEVPVRKDYIHLADFRADPEAHRLPTESGRIVLHSETLAALQYADCPPHASWVEPPEWLQGARAREYPFHLLSPQPKNRLHSQIDYGHFSQQDKVGGKEPLVLNPEDAKRIGVGDGEIARVFNDRGQCLAGVRISDEVRCGVALLPTGAWFAPAQQHAESGVADEPPLELNGNANVLTLDRGSSAFSGGCSAHTCLVAIERYTQA
ncbi:MAG: molybdopterin-dependent oxidoreductase [Burkholderiaceae bacterium]